MRASIRNIRRIRSADIEIGPGITLVAGENDNGKSSTLGAIAAALTGGSVLPGILKKDLSQLVHDGAEVGAIQVQGDQGTIDIRVPGDFMTTETPPRASLFAAGLASLVDMDQTARSTALIAALKATPKRSEIFKALREIGLAENAMARLMRDEGKKHGEIAERLRQDNLPMDEFGLFLASLGGGWDEAHARRVEQNKRDKGAWEQITKQKRYGSQIAADWKPAGWVLAMDMVTIAEAEEHLEKARARHAEALKNAGASDSERAAKQALKDDLQNRVKAHYAAVEAQQAADRRATAAQTLLDGLPIPATANEALCCPHCQGRIRIGRNVNGDVLEKADVALPQDEIKKRREARADASGDLSNAKVAAGEASLATIRAKADMDDAIAAEKWLKDHPAGGTGGASDVAAALTDMQQAEVGVTMLKQRAEAMAKHREIQKNEALIAILDPKGLRRGALVDCVQTFNETHLAPIAEVTGWRRVQIMLDDDGIGITYGGRPYRHLGQSVQYRVRVTLQVAFAQIDGSELLIVDGADILTPGAPDGRGSLFRLLHSLAIPSLVGMTLGPKDVVIDLSETRGKDGRTYGRSYVVCDGVVAALVREAA
jgi:hypothetical protein